MEILTANKAKTHFGELLIKAQKEPVQIDKNGKPVVMVISIEDYEANEHIKLQMLKDSYKKAMYEIEKGLYEDDADEFFEKMLNGENDE
jgi:prevent-host-death family protein